VNSIIAKIFHDPSNKTSVNIFIADFNIAAADSVVEELNQAGKAKAAAAQIDVSDWNQQAHAFDKAIAAFGKIDYVYPIAGIGERKWIPNDPNSTGWQAPDLSVSRSHHSLMDADGSFAGH
jgi:NAD(P)-dependent dehydrogenase (short-subunit alcohol dehydrogenase family)